MHLRDVAGGSDLVLIEGTGRHIADTRLQQGRRLRSRLFFCSGMCVGEPGLQTWMRASKYLWPTEERSASLSLFSTCLCRSSTSFALSTCSCVASEGRG